MTPAECFQVLQSQFDDGRDRLQFNQAWRKLSEADKLALTKAVSKLHEHSKAAAGRLSTGSEQCQQGNPTGETITQVVTVEVESWTVSSG